MRVLYYSDNASGHNQRFLKKLAASGHEIWFCDATASPRAEGWLPRGINELVPSAPLPREASPEAVKKGVNEVKRMLAEVKPDVVHAGPVQSAGYGIALAEFHPMLLMSWGSDILLSSEGDAEWQGATRIALEGCDALFVDSATVLEKGNEIAILSDDRLLQFPWGVELARYTRTAAERDAANARRERNEFVFICTRSWEPLYGIDTTLEAFRIAHSKNNALRLVLLGDGSMAPLVREFIAERKLEGVIETPGAVSADEVAKRFRAADGYISCARSDGTSISLLEALATGLPAIVTDIAPNREWVTPDENGWLATTAQDFADAMLKTAELGESELKKIGEANRRVAAERADWDANFPKLLHMYEHIVRNQ